jgi:hypothetical protein
MESGQAPNPVTRTLDELAEIWMDFTSEPDPRLLRWIVNDDSRQMVETFLRSEAEVAGNTPDLFLLFENPFTSGEDYGATLLADLSDALERDQEEIQGAGCAVGWKPPPPHPRLADPQIFARAVGSLAEFYSDDADHVAIVLLPSSIADPREWGDWLWVVIHSDLPPEVRICTVEMEHSRALDRISDAAGDLVRVQKPEIDFLGLLKQLSALSGGSGPGVNFRRHLLNLLALSSGDPGRLPRASAPALNIARTQKWPALEALVHFVIGGALLNAGKPKEAAVAYEHSEAAVAEPEDGDEEVGDEEVAKKVRFHSRLSQGSALLSGKEYREAARVFESAVPLAQEQTDAREQMTIECWRLASFSHEQANQPDESWRCGLLAFQVGEEMELEDRRNTSLPYAGVGLLRVCGDLPEVCGRDGLEGWLRERLGPDWKELVEPGGAPP